MWLWSEIDQSLQELSPGATNKFLDSKNVEATVERSTRFQ